MRVAVLADIHGNLPACEAVLDDIKKQSPDYIIAAGDLALRGAFPAETTDLLFSSCHSLLIGNTDCYITGTYLGGAYRSRDHWKTELLEWTRDRLGAARVAKMAQMPFSVRYSPRPGQDLYICHANPRNLEDSLEPTLDEATLKRFLQHLDASAIAFGHLHFPYRRRVGRLVVADVASAGIPRDGDMRPGLGAFHLHAQGLARADSSRALLRAEGDSGHHRPARAGRTAAHPQNARGPLQAPPRPRGGRAETLGASPGLPTLPAATPRSSCFSQTRRPDANRSARAPRP